MHLPPRQHLHAICILLLAALAIRSAILRLYSLIFTEDLSQFTAPRSVPLQNAIEDLSSHGIEDIPDLIFG